MTGHRCTWAILICVLIANPAFAQTPDSVTAEDEVLLAFVQLGNFTDRGIVAQIFGESTIPMTNAEVESDAEKAVPGDLRELLQSRKNNLSESSPNLPLLIKVEDHSVKATLYRFQKYGLIELFNNENSKLLDAPLSHRKELAARFATIAEQISKTIAATFTKDLTESRKIVIAGHARALSVELDLEIFKALSPNECVRIGKLLSHLLPNAIADAKQWNRRVNLGSAFLDTNERNGRQR